MEFNNCLADLFVSVIQFLKIINVSGFIAL